MKFIIQKLLITLSFVSQEENFKFELVLGCRRAEADHAHLRVCNASGRFYWEWFNCVNHR